MALIRTEFAERIGTIAFDHYAKRNVLSKALIGECLATLERFRAERARVVILRAAAPGAVWSSGHSVNELPHANRDPLPYDDPLEQLLRAVRQFPAPVIAMVQGVAWGGACDLVMACDIVFGDESCGFAITPAKIGLPYNAQGIQHFLSRLPLNIVTEMFCTAEPILAERALRLGIVNEIFPADMLEARTLATAQVITTRSAEAIASFKAIAVALADAAPLSAGTFERLHGLRRNVYFGHDYSEGVAAFLEKRPARFG